MSGDDAGTIYVKIVVKNGDGNTRENASNAVYALFPAARLNGVRRKNDDTAFNYRVDTTSLNRNGGEALVPRDEVCAGLLCKLVEALRPAMTVVSCRMLYITAEGIRVKIVVTP